VSVLSNDQALRVPGVEVWEALLLNSKVCKVGAAVASACWEDN
jgi:hypothetical protein